MRIMRCPSCDGYAWVEDDDGSVVDCDWCDGVGYVYRDATDLDYRIPEADYGKVADELERLEIERLRELGYTGTAKKPWQRSASTDEDDE